MKIRHDLLWAIVVLKRPLLSPMIEKIFKQMFKFVFPPMLHRQHYNKPYDWIFAKDHKMPGLGTTICDKLFSILRKVLSE